MCVTFSNLVEGEQRNNLEFIPYLDLILNLIQLLYNTTSNSSAASGQSPERLQNELCSLQLNM